MARPLSGLLPVYTINEYPKSGGTWVGQMLAEALGLPFPRNRIPAVRSSVIHGHYLDPRGMRNVVVVWRDGRDVMTSWYHQCLFEHGRGNARQVDRVRADLGFDDYNDVRENLPAFLRYAFTRQRYPGFSWAEFVRRWHGRDDATHVRYEDVHADPAGALRCLAEAAGRRLSEARAARIAERFSFERQSGRARGEGEKGSFLRKGIVGDWHNHFSAEARAVFREFAGDELVRLGYEPDYDWSAAQ